MEITATKCVLPTDYKYCSSLFSFPVLALHFPIMRSGNEPWTTTGLPHIYYTEERQSIRDFLLFRTGEIIVRPQPT